LVPVFLFDEYLVPQLQVQQHPQPHMMIDLAAAMLIEHLLNGFFSKKAGANKMGILK
jgi:hypothetical protein